MILPNEPTGHTRLAQWGRKVVRALRSMEIRPGPNYRVKQTALGTVLEIGPSSGGGTVQLTDCATGKTYLVQATEVTEE